MQDIPPQRPHYLPALPDQKRPAITPAPGSKSSTVSFSLPTKATKAGVFLHSKTPSSLPLSASDDWKKISKAAPRQWATFFTLSLPTLYSKGRKELVEDALLAFHAALTILWTAEPRLVAYGFPTKESALKVTPLEACPAHPHDDPKSKFTKPFVEQYVQYFYPKTGQHPWIRMYLGHDSAPDALVESVSHSLLTDDSRLKIDTIQAPQIQTCGWLLGAHRNMDLPHYERLLNALPDLSGFPTALTCKILKLRYNEPKTGEVWAVHVQCDAKKRSATNLALKKLYNRRNPGDLGKLPDGKVFKYVPYFGYQKDRVPSDLSAYQKLRIRQQQFHEKHINHPVSGITDLDLPMKLGGESFTLRQLMLSIRCPSNLEFPLFLSVDYNSYRREFSALFHVDNTVQAQAILDTLPVYLEARYGEKIWDWFSADLRSTLSGFTWNEEKSCVEAPPTEDLNFLLSGQYGDLQDWEKVKDTDMPELTSPTSVKIHLPTFFNPDHRLPGSGGFDGNNSCASCKTNTTNATTKIQNMPPDVVGDSKDDSSDMTSMTSGTYSHASSSGSAPPKGASGQRAGDEQPHVS